MTFPVATVDYYGIELLTRIGTFDAEMAREIFEDHYYTCDGWDIPAGGTVLDIGGGIGAFAVYAAAHGAGEIHTFEPIPESFSLLAANVASIDSIIAEQAAVTVKTGPVKMSGFHPMDDGTINTGLPAISDDGLEVPGLSIHEVIARRIHWDLVKLDIEGHEYAVLEEMTPDELAKVDVFTMEFHGTDETTTHAQGLALGASLERHGFAVEVAWAWGLQGRLRARR